MEFNKTEASILELLKKGKYRSLEIKERLNLGFHNLYPALHRLRVNGFLIGEKKGNMLYYKLVKQEPKQ